jgi:two-component system, NtrC family, nitrogen regulation sensor histidine kinase NtrY
VTHRARLIAYLVAVHVLLAAAGVALLIEHPLWLFPVELIFAISLLVGIGLTRRMFWSLDVSHAGAQLLHDGEFTSRLREVGQPEIDRLITLYNRMVDSLRDKRTQLQEQHHFLSHILRVSPSGIVILDFDRRVADANPSAQRLLERSPAALTGRPLEEAGGPLAAALASLPPNQTQVVALSGSRQVRCHHGTFIDRGFPRSFLLIEELTEELRHAERGAYEKLIRVMAHEVNNSVAASNSLLHSCLTYGKELAPSSRADFEDAIGIVIARTEQLNGFMRRFASVFKLPPPARQPERIVELVEGCVRLLRSKPDASAITWQWDLDDRELEVPVDRGQFEQAILNVLKNAVEAAGARGTIAIALRAHNGGQPRLTIEDSGPELSPEARANLFTPFFSTKPDGQGIGLTLVREILTAHGFDYSLERLEGQPTRFTITF